MPRRTDISSILVLGSGPIVIGQAAEFDYSGTQAVKTLRQEGFRVVLVNSNPATIMTDPEFAHRTYIAPLTPESVEQIIAREKPDALLPTLGGQTALNLAVALSESGALQRHGVKLLGAGVEAIRRAEDRQLFKAAAERAGLAVPRSGLAHSVEEAQQIADRIGFPLILRPSFTLGGLGGATCADPESYRAAVEAGLEASPVHSVLVEESIAGWKEFELEVVRDRKDNVVVVCSIENVDPMGVHTGDSITVAPALTLTDVEYQAMRDDARRLMREIGVETGGSNVQFAVAPKTGRRVVIEMNPRVSRSSALASKATGYPIAKVAARLAVGYTLDEIRNDITGETPAAFEPALDYVVVKVPRFNFEKFPHADTTLHTSMKSVGEAMAIGRTFQEALQKALRSLEIGSHGLESPFGRDPGRPGYREYSAEDRAIVEARLRVPGPQRVWYVAEAVRAAFDPERICRLTGMDPWFVREIAGIVRAEHEFLAAATGHGLTMFEARPGEWGSASGQPAKGNGVAQDAEKKPADGAAAGTWDSMPHSGTGAEVRRPRPRLVAPPVALDMARVRELKRMGFSDARIAKVAGVREGLPGELAERTGMHRVYKRVDTCAAEFEAKTPYLYSTWDGDESEVPPSLKRKVMILGSGPNRIGQGIEFDYCCVHAAFALREAGFETVMVNCNPETVSTDFDTADRLYFEPLTLEDVTAIARAERPVGTIVQFGGQTPLKLAAGLARRGIRVLGTPAEAIDRAEDRELFARLVAECGLLQPEHGTARTPEDAREVARRLGFPLMVRPGFVLGGRAMTIVHDESELDACTEEALRESAGKPVLVDRFLRDAVEVDVDCVADGTDVIVAGVMEHIEEAGIHSGDSACVLPPHRLSAETVAELERQTEVLARRLGVVGLMNVQFAIEEGRIFVLEANPRASRTVPFVSKATGFPLAKVAALVQAGIPLAKQGVAKPPRPAYYAVKEAVFPFMRFPGVDPVLGPEMRSTGEVMGICRSHAVAFAFAQEAAGNTLPRSGTVFLSVRDDDKPELEDVARRLSGLGFALTATRGTQAFLAGKGIAAGVLNKVPEGPPHAVEMLRRREIAFVVNTTKGRRSIEDATSMRRETLRQGVAYVTTMEAARAAVEAMEALREHRGELRCLQELHGMVQDGAAV